MPSETLVKICGLTTLEAIDACIEAEADFMGFVFYPPSRRHLSHEKAAALISRVPSHIKTVGLFVNATDDEIASVLAKTPLDMLQLHGHEDAARIMAIKSRFNLPVMKALRVAAPEDLVQLGQLQSVSDWILFDAKVEGAGAQPGGNGVAFDWRLLKTLKIPKPWMLSGGLTLENISAALVEVSPHAVDVSSGVEDVPGMKNPAKIRSFLHAVKQA